MNVVKLAAVLTALLSSTVISTASVAAQSVSQSELESRYDRAIAAGYKALFLCSAIASAERAGTTRTPESVIEWELEGVQEPLNDVIGDLPFEIHREGHRKPLDHTRVTFADDMPPRIARSFGDAGCKLGPIGIEVDVGGTQAGLDPVVAEARFDRDIPTTAIPRPIHDGAFGGAYGNDTRTTAIVIVRDGEAVFGRFAPGFDRRTPQRTWSVAKSIAATYVGALLHRGELDIASSAGLGANDADPRRAITFDHLLRMASGRYSDTPGNRTDPIYFGGATVAEKAASWPLLYKPGSVFRYSNNDTLMAVAGAVYRKSNFTPERMLAEMGMSRTIAETDWTEAAFPYSNAWKGEKDTQAVIDLFHDPQATDFTGGYILSSQVWSTASDLARLGQLYLDDGVLPNGERILPEGWLDYVSTPSGPQPDGTRGWGYGAGWWLLNNSDGIPADTIMAAGNRGQYVVVVPSRDIVIVRRGEDPAGGSGFDVEAFTRDVLAALPVD